MRKKMILMGLCLSMCLTCTAFATQVDEFGNEINWVDDGVTGEDAAGEELNYIPPNADLLESGRLEQSESEAESIAEIVEQNRLEESDVGKTTITARFAAPENWRGSNIQVSLYNKDLWNGYTIYIYKQNGFESVEELPMGTYEVRGAMVVGDTNNVYPLLADANGRAEFVLGDMNEAVVINVELGGSNNYIVEKERETSQAAMDGEKNEAESKATNNNRGINQFVKDNLIFGIILICGVVAFLIKSKRDEEN